MFSDNKGTDVTCKKPYHMYPDNMSTCILNCIDKQISCYHCTSLSGIGLRLNDPTHMEYNPSQEVFDFFYIMRIRDEDKGIHCHNKKRYVIGLLFSELSSEITTYSEYFIEK